MNIKMSNLNLKFILNEKLEYKVLSFLKMCIYINLLLYNKYAIAQETPTNLNSCSKNLPTGNPYLDNIEKSKCVYNQFQKYFELALKEKKNWFTNNNIKVNSEKFQSSSYLLQLPSNIVADNQNFSNVVQSCDLNNMNYLRSDLNQYPNLDSRKTPFSNEVNNSYCLLQNTFKNLKNSSITFMPEITNYEGIDFNKEKLILKQSDTLVVVVPGIFGEFIESTAFGELFGQGLSKLENKNGNYNESSFAKRFKSWVERYSSSNETIKKLTISKRVTLKDIDSFSYEDFVNGTDHFYKDKNVNIDEWIKVSSYDDHDGEPLFKLAVMGLAPMSLESIGKQYNLAVIYLRRLNKFMKIYKKMYGRYPGQIILVGYSRGTPIAYEMLSILNKDTKNDIENGIRTSAKEWKNSVKSMLSLGGVSLGSSLADLSVIDREIMPDKIKLLHAFRDLMVNLEVVTAKDIEEFNNHWLEIITNEKKIAIKNDGTININANLRFNLNFIVKIIKNINNYNQFLMKVKKISYDGKNGSLFSSLYESIIDLEDLYTNLVLLIEDFKDIGGIKTKIDGFIAANLLLTKLPQLKMSYSKLIIKVREILHNLTILPIPGMSLVNKNIDIESLIPKINANSDFYTKILNNFGMDLINDKNIININDPLKIFSKVNDLLIRFKVFFEHAWDGGHELSTLSRLSWLVDNAKYLPYQNFKYYTVNAVIGDSGTDYYKSGMNRCFNKSIDQVFLDLSSKEIKSVGLNNDSAFKNNKISSINEGDGLDFTFASTEQSDSQVTWPKAILWEYLVSKITNNKVNINSSILATVCTHHWGLVLPYAAYNETEINHATGIKNKGYSYANVNPFPRKEFLLALVLTINQDRKNNNYIRNDL